MPWSWAETGSGSTALVVLPGAVGGAGLFFVLFEELSPLVRVIAVDVPYVSEAAPTLEQLDTLLRGRGVEHAIFLGASFSGLLVQAYARLYPGRTRALILSHTGAIDPARAPRERAYATRTAKLPAWLIRGLLRLVVRLLTRRASDGAFWVRRYDEALAPLTREAMVSRYSLAASIEELPARPPWQDDVLVIHSDSDAIAKPADQERLRQALPAGAMAPVHGRRAQLLRERPGGLRRGHPDVRGRPTPPLTRSPPGSTPRTGRCPPRSSTSSRSRSASPAPSPRSSRPPSTRPPAAPARSPPA